MPCDYHASCVSSNARNLPEDPSRVATSIFRIKISSDQTEEENWIIDTYLADNSIHSIVDLGESLGKTECLCSLVSFISLDSTRSSSISV